MLFRAFDENRDEQIDFKELACGVSAACAGPVVERHKCVFPVRFRVPGIEGNARGSTVLFFFSVCFKVFDSDGDGSLSEAEINEMARVLLEARVEVRRGDASSPVNDGDCVIKQGKKGIFFLLTRSLVFSDRELCPCLILSRRSRGARRQSARQSLRPTRQLEASRLPRLGYVKLADCEPAFASPRSEWKKTVY
jgi:hypothetical protein